MGQIVVGDNLVGSTPNIDPWGANYVDANGKRRNGCIDCEKLVNTLTYVQTKFRLTANAAMCAQLQAHCAVCWPCMCGPSLA